MKIKGIPVGTPMPRSDWAQTDPKKANYILNKPDIASIKNEQDRQKALLANLSTLKEGSTTGDAELIDIRSGYLGDTFKNAGDAVREQSKRISDKVDTKAAIVEENAYLERVSNGHFYKLPVDDSHLMDMWIVDKTSGEIVKGSSETDPAMPPRKGSDFIKCPKYLCLNYTNTATTFYIYFYDLVGGAYVPRWDIISETTGTREKNYIKRSTMLDRHYVIEIPDGVYMQVGDMDNGEAVEFYGWDGENFGMPMSAECILPKTAGDTFSMSVDGSSGVTVPGKARFIVSKGISKIGTINAYVGGKVENIDSETVQFTKLPDGYDFFHVRLLENTGGEKTRIGDVSDVLSVVVDTESEKPSGEAVNVLNNCKKFCSIGWKPVADLNAEYKNGTDPFNIFKAGVIYNGIPYGSHWTRAHYVGWHISPHTFVNAANDSDSILYKERLAADDYDAPYYSTVCSTFATLCAGWPYPQTTSGMLRDPYLKLAPSHTPAIGQVYVKPNHHTMIPERVDHLDGSVAISSYEGWAPLATRTTRYSNVDMPGFMSNWRDHYDGYGYAAHHINANSSLKWEDNKDNNVPYIGMSEEDLKIVGGSARPYKGDKSVYTSAETSVLVNIKDVNATVLYLQKDSEEALSINISGATQIDVKNHLNGDGIYWVWTDKGATKESFEYHVITPIKYKRTAGGVPVLSSKDFWYVTFRVEGGSKPAALIAQPPADSYRYLTEDGSKCTVVSMVFYKGTYGAYAVKPEWDGSLPDDDGGGTGADGYTPVKGIDYWTDADKTEMVADVIAALPIYDGEVV